MSEPEGAGGPDALKALYRDTIRRHAAEPSGFERPIEATHTHELYNALCGDRVEVLLRLDQDAITEAAFRGEACAICMASASLLCELSPGKPPQQVRRLAMELAEALNPPVGADSSATGVAGAQAQRGARPESRMNPLPQETADLPEELHPLLGVRPYPSRVRCATLPWEAAVAALDAA